MLKQVRPSLGVFELSSFSHGIFFAQILNNLIKSQLLRELFPYYPTPLICFSAFLYCLTQSTEPWVSRDFSMYLSHLVCHFIIICCHLINSYPPLYWTGSSLKPWVTLASFLLSSQHILQDLVPTQQTQTSQLNEKSRDQKVLRG